MFRWDLVRQYLFSNVFFQAAWLTLWISVVAQFSGVVIGLLLALMRMSRFSLYSLFSSVPLSARFSSLISALAQPFEPLARVPFFALIGRGLMGFARFPILSGLVRLYIWFFRGSPLLVQVLLLWIGLPKITHNNPFFILPAYLCVLVAFSLNEGAYMAEIIRAGITSVDTGQLEAAKSLGMRYALAMRRIVLPQAIRVIVPPLGNEFNNMLKTTSIASVITLHELTYTADLFGAPTFSYFELLIVATFYYLVLTTLWGYFQSWIERRLDPNRITKYDIQERKGFAERALGIGSSRSKGSGSLIGGR